jgi:hypothetical protein
LSALIAAVSLPPAGHCQSLQSPRAPGEASSGGWTSPTADRDMIWRDDAHRRARIDAVRGHPDFAGEEARIREDLDAGLEQGWLTRDDFLIFGRQLHQTEVRESTLMFRYSDSLPLEERAGIRYALDQLRRQLDETRDGR